MRALLCLLIVVFVAGCAAEMKDDLKIRAKKEILEAESAFQQMVKEKGLREAFFFFADTNAAIIRGEKLIAGKQAIREYYRNQPEDDMQLNWTPDFVEVSSSGDMGYTYGSYTFSVTDSSGVRKEGKGIFHTVWKKQPDGSWKFVWD